MPRQLADADSAQTDAALAQQQAADDAPAKTPAVEMFRAKEPIFIGNVRAYNKGDLVTAGNVERNNLQDKVEPVPASS